MRKVVYAAFWSAGFNLSLLGGSPVLAQEIRDKNSFELYILQASISQVLQQLKLYFDVDFHIEPGLNQTISSLRLKGDLVDVVTALEEQSDVVFFEFNNVIYASQPGSIETKILQIKEADPDYAIRSLEQSGLPLSEFTVSRVAGSDSLVLTAPDEFIKIAEALLLSMKPEIRSNGNTILVRRGMDITTEIVD